MALDTAVPCSLCAVHWLCEVLMVSMPPPITVRNSTTHPMGAVVLHVVYHWDNAEMAAQGNASLKENNGKSADTANSIYRKGEPEDRRFLFYDNTVGLDGAISLHCI
ncbi:hypothetical protein EYF80_016070 [Liparis tanakae]|uniref:Uncharacterized protein n=1 Tax=Liparis tanakae TaxID=230148 RepID=A0A4Z2I781_9TELE|nr:hypothetical protein EYF80_016070 [Liparis tanakae]